MERDAHALDDVERGFVDLPDVVLREQFELDALADVALVSVGHGRLLQKRPDSTAAMISVEFAIELRGEFPARAGEDAVGDGPRLVFQTRAARALPALVGPGLAEARLPDSRTCARVCRPKR